MKQQSSTQPEEQTFLEAFILSTEDALLTMAGITSSYQQLEPSLSLSNSDSLIYSTMSVQGDSSGFVGIAILPELAASIISAILGQNPEELAEDEVIGGVAEVLNVIAGNAKARLKGTSDHFEITPPSCADLSLISEQYLNVPSSIALTFDVEGTPFWILINLR